MARLTTIIFLCVALLCTGCASGDIVKPYNPMGFSGKISQEAEKHFAMARILWRQNASECSDVEKALEHLDKAIEVQDDYAEAYFWRAKALDQAGYGEDAFDDLSKSIRLNPVPEAYAFRGAVSVRLGNLLGARKDIEYALSLRSNLPLAIESQGLLEQALGNQAKACEYFQDACDDGLCFELERAQTKGLCQ